MAAFKRVLVAVDLTPTSDSLLRRVLLICGEDVEKIDLVHVLRSDLYSSGSVNQLPFADADLRRERDRALYRIRELLRRNSLRIDPDRIHIRIGEPATEIKRLAFELHADLVIVGSHCRREGWVAVPGPTTNCVLQGIESDVMAVRI